MAEPICILAATANRHKADEIRSILGPGFAVASLNDLTNPPRLVEDQPTFAGNATVKALQLKQYLAANHAEMPARLRHSDGWVLADDSGLEVDALGGAPGVHSARFANLDGTGGDGNAPDALNNAKLLQMLANVPEDRRTARFRCVLALIELTRPGVGSTRCSREPVLFEGTCEGRIGFEPRGSGGFGYDPLFWPRGHGASFAELGQEIKNGLSHRYRALVKMRRWLGLRLGHEIA